MLLGSAALARCEIFFSEDMQHRRRIGPMTILSPFRLQPDFNFSR
jgi:predicted nucleic acid-binding protein